MTKVNKSDFVREVAKATGYSIKNIDEVFTAIENTIVADLKDDKSVKVFSFLTLETAKKDARTARNPQTGATVEVPAKVVPKVKIGKALKDAVNE